MMNYALGMMKMNNEKDYSEMKEISEYLRLDSKRFDNGNEETE